MFSTHEGLDARGVDDASWWLPRGALLDASWWMARAASPIAFGFAVSLLTYDVLQLANAAGIAIVRVQPDDVPLFLRWRVGMSAGVISAAASCWVPFGKVSKIVAWALTAACVAHVLVVAFAP